MIVFFFFSLFSNKKRYDFPVYLYQCNAFACILLQVWADVYAKALEGKDLKEILSGFHNAGPAVGAASASAGAAGAGEAAAEEAAAEEEAEESDEDMGFGLFD